MKIKGKTVKQIIELLDSEIEELHLKKIASNEITSTLPNLKRVPDLRTLEVSFDNYNQITDSTLFLLQELLKHDPPFVTINFPYGGFNSDKCHLIIPLLKDTFELTLRRCSSKIPLQGRHRKVNIIDSLVTLGKVKCTSLTVGLNDYSNSGNKEFIGLPIDDNLIEAHGQSIGNNPELIELYLGIGCYHPAIINSVVKLPKIQLVNFYEARLSFSNHCQAVMLKLIEKDSLRELSFGARIFNSSLSDIYLSVKKNSSLRKLKIDWSGDNWEGNVWHDMLLNDGGVCSCGLSTHDFRAPKNHWRECELPYRRKIRTEIEEVLRQRRKREKSLQELCSKIIRREKLDYSVVPSVVRDQLTLS